MKLSTKHLFATLSLLTALTLAPTSAFAKGSVHVDIPGLSIGVHDNHRSYTRHRNEKRHYREGRDHYYSDRRYKRDRQYYNNRHYNDRRSQSKRRYNDNNYYSGSRYNNRYRNDGYRVEVCPIDGYSRYYDRSSNCYEHKGHYHCS